MKIPAISGSIYTVSHLRTQTTQAPASSQAPTTSSSNQTSIVDNDGDEATENYVQRLLEYRQKAAAARNGVDIKV